MCSPTNLIYVIGMSPFQTDWSRAHQLAIPTEKETFARGNKTPESMEPTTMTSRPQARSATSSSVPDKRYLRQCHLAVMTIRIVCDRDHFDRHPVHNRRLL